MVQPRLLAPETTKCLISGLLFFLAHSVVASMARTADLAIGNRRGQERSLVLRYWIKVSTIRASSLRSPISGWLGTWFKRATRARAALASDMATRRSPSRGVSPTEPPPMKRMAVSG